MYLSSFLYYLLFGSSVLVYGIGLSSEIKQTHSVKGLALRISKMAICVLLTVFFSYLITKNVLLQIGIAELYPIISLIIYLCLSVFLEILFRLTTDKSNSEIAVPILIVLLSLNEGFNLTECLVIASSCLLSFFILFPILYSLIYRIKIIYPKSKIRQQGFLLLSIAVLLIIIAAWNASWLNPGVIK